MKIYGSLQGSSGGAYSQGPRFKFWHINFSLRYENFFQLYLQIKRILNEKILKAVFEKKNFFMYSEMIFWFHFQRKITDFTMIIAEALSGKTSLKYVI